MPTGYTSDVCDGKVTDFRKFAMNCARAFGACVEMRDDPMDKEIPDQFKPSDYHLNGIEKAERQLKSLEKITEDDADRKAEADYKKRLKEWDGYITEANLIKKRLEDMRKQVVAWTPPTPDHEGMKRFMLEQLDETIRFDGKSDYWKKEKRKTVKMSGREWLFEMKQGARKDIKYHTDGHEKEVKRARERTAWVRELRDSLKEKETSK